MNNIKDYTKGWIVGNFEPSLFKSEDVEIAVKVYQQGTKEDRHYHKIANEYTILLEGRVKINGHLLEKGEIFLAIPNSINEFESITDSTVLVIKSPSVPGDKYLI